MPQIIVISDTHLRRQEDKLPKALVESFKDADLIVHCGDFEELFVLETLKEYGEVRAVHGNMDSAELKETLPAVSVFDFEGFRFGITHGTGPPLGLERRVVSLLKKHCDIEDLDAILYGHSHIPKKSERKGLLLLNPGSPTDKRYAPFNSFGVLRLSRSGIDAEIVKI